MKARANGIDIHCEISGSGPWLSLSHSLCCDGSMWAPQLAALERRFTVLRIDTRGHGGTDAPAGAYNFEQLTDDVLGLLDALRIERTHSVGLSMGGMIGQHLALTAPDRVERLVIANSSSRIPPEAGPLWDERIRLARAGGCAALVEGTLARWFTEPFRAARPMSWPASAHRSPPRRWADLPAVPPPFAPSTSPRGYRRCAPEPA